MRVTKLENIMKRIIGWGKVLIMPKEGDDDGADTFEAVYAKKLILPFDFKIRRNFFFTYFLFHASIQVKSSHSE